ncbi:MAG: VOC family protein [Phycisphaerales bacterium]
MSHGMFCWFELTTRDVERGRGFYGAVMGASTRGMPSGADAEGDAYFLFEVSGHTVAGLNPMGDRFPPAAPSHWMPYVAVDDVDHVCRTAEALGGRVRFGPADISIGRFAILCDPTGGVFSVFRAHAGATDGTNPIGPGAFVWCELVTRDVAIASEFYAKLFGWTPQFCTLGASSYIEMKAGARPVASVFEACADESASVAHWCPYLCVDDIDAALAAVVRHGGHKLCEPMELPGEGPCAGRYAGVTDPTGAHIALFEPRSPIM